MINKKLNAVNVNRFILNDTLQESFKLYKDRQITNVKMDEFGFVSSIVSDEVDYIVEVLIKSDHLVEYYCSCGRSECCLHVGAFLYYLNNDGVNVATNNSINTLVLEKALTLVNNLTEVETKDLLKEMLRYSRNLSYVKNKYKEVFLETNLESYEYHLEELFTQYVENERVIHTKEEQFLDKLQKLVKMAMELINSDNFNEGYNFYLKIIRNLSKLELNLLNDYYYQKYCHIFVNFYEKTLMNVIYRRDYRYFKYIELAYIDIDNIYLYFSSKSDIDSTKASLIMEFIKEVAKNFDSMDAEFSNTENFYELHYYYLEFYYRVDAKAAIVTAANYLKYYKVRLMLVKHYVKNSEVQKARTLLEEGLETSYCIYYIKPLLQIYMRYDYQKYHSLLYKSYFEYDLYNKEYFELLKKTQGFDINKFLESFNLDDGYPDSYLDVLVDYRFYDKLLKALEEIDNFEDLKKYNKYLIISHNTELLNLYENLILREYKRGFDRELIIRHLDYFKQLPNAYEIYESILRSINL